MVVTIKKWIDALVWGDLLRGYGLAGRMVTGVLRNAYAVLRDVFSGQLTLRAMSLVYTTLLSIVPLIAVSFSMLKAFDVHKELEPHLFGLLEPFGDKGVEFGTEVMTLVNNVNGNVLGGIGLAFFVYTAISMVKKVEDAFNYVWYVTKPRSLAKRIVEYLAVLVIGSLSAAIALKALASFLSQDLVVSMQDNSVIAPMVTLTNALTPYVVVISIFTFLYTFMPNTVVKFRSALVGGIAGGVLWATTSKIFAAFLANSTDRQAIYASFAIAISMLIWLYLNWLILLIGSQIAFYFQNPAYLRIGRREPRLSNSMREHVALNIMYLVGKEFRQPKQGVDLSSLSRSMRIPTITLAPIAASLETSGLITTSENEQILPGREMARIKLSHILAVVRSDGETGSHRSPRWDDLVKTVGMNLDEAVERTLSDQTLSDLLDKSDS